MKIYRKAQNTLNEDFFSWFGNSKVVDKNGDPMPVFHGTNQPIENFDPDRLGENTKAVSSRDGFFFTEDKNEAAKYAHLSAKQQVVNAVEQEKKEEELLKQIENASNRRDWNLYEKLTIELEDLSLGAIYKEPSGHRIYSVYLSAQNPMIYHNVGPQGTGAVSKLINQAKDQGYDSVKLIDIEDGYISPTTQWVVFSPSQIKIIDESWEEM